MVHDPRRPHPTTLHTLETSRTLTIRATMGGAPHGVESAPWGQAKGAWRAACLDRPPGLPSPETCGRVCAVLAPARRPQAVVRGLKARADRRHERGARAGHPRRRSLERADGTGPRPVVKAWAAAHALGLAPCTVDANTTELTALRAWRRRRHLAGAVVPLEARGCQVESARQIPAQGAADGLRCKAKQPGLSREGDDLGPWRRGAHPRAHPVACGRADQVEGGHGRRETRRVWSTDARAGVISGERWAGRSRLVLVASLRQLGAADRVERRDALSSLPGAPEEDAQRLNRVIRTHGERDNRVPWGLDVAMGAEVTRTRTGESAQPLALRRQLALN